VRVCFTDNLIERGGNSSLPLAGRRQLGSSDALRCAIQRTSTRLGDRSFAIAGPRLWNSLPDELPHPTDIRQNQTHSDFSF